MFHANLETWNQYCERQRKFRQEFGGDQTAINKAILSNIQLSGPALTTFTGGRQLVNLSGGGPQESKQSQKIQKIVVDLSKPPPLITGSGTGADNIVIYYFFLFNSLSIFRQIWLPIQFL